MCEVAIYGAGNRGKELYRLLHKYNYIVNCFIDSSFEKQGKFIWDIPVISLEEYIFNGKKCDVIVSINDYEVEECLKESNIKYYLFEFGIKSFFNQKKVKELIDQILLKEYMLCQFEEASIFKEYEGNWFRKEFYNEFNRELIQKMINKEQTILNSELYDVIYSDEYYENRCDMHLVYNLLNKFCKKGDRIIDLGAGHGFFLDELKKTGRYRLVACEGSPNRCVYLRNRKYETIENEIENLKDIENLSIDAVVCMETLEHVRDVEKSVLEIYRILKSGGYCWITVPEGALCDCQTHVRQFTINSLGYLFKKNGFTIENIQNVPDSYIRLKGHILMQCQKGQE